MKLPQANLQSIHRDGRTDPHRSAAHGIEPMFLGSALNWVKDKAKSVVKPAACAACNLLPNPAAKAACRAVAC